VAGPAGLAAAAPTALAPARSPRRCGWGTRPRPTGRCRTRCRCAGRRRARPRSARTAGGVRRAAPPRRAGPGVLRARAVAARGQVPLVLLDEPSEDLDAAGERGVAAVLDALRGTATVVLVTHSLRLASVADRVVRLEAGRVVRDERQVPQALAPAPVPVERLGRPPRPRLPPPAGAPGTCCGPCAWTPPGSGGGRPWSWGSRRWELWPAWGSRRRARGWCSGRPSTPGCRRWPSRPVARCAPAR
jgi:hypothetical protein